MRRLGLRSACRRGEPQGRRAALGGFWGRLSGGITRRGAGTASRPGVKLLSLVQLVINKSNGQFDFTPCVCLCGTWHAPALLLPSETVSARVILEACEVSVEEKSPGLCHRFETVSEHDLQSVFYCWCRCTSYSFQIFRRQVHPSSRAASWQLACLGKPEGATNILVKTSPTSPKRNICSLACCSFLWQDSSCSSNAELGNSSAGV